jgi:hypothetical protein
MNRPRGHIRPLPTRRRAASVGGLALACAMVLALAVPAGAAVTWGPVRRVGPFTTWNPGNALARASGTILTVWSSDCPPPKGACAGDPRPRMGVFMQRTRFDSVSWTKPRRLSPATSHAERASVAADGQLAIVGWVTQRSYLRYRGSGPRQFVIRRSGDRGGTWSGSIPMSVRGGRVDYPQMAVAGNTAYAVWTDANTGAIRLATSLDGARTWLRKTIGFTTSVPVSGEGFAGYPTVGASGANVVVSWIENLAGGQVAKVSSQRGADLVGAPIEPITGASPNDGFHYAVAKGAQDGLSNDVALAFTTQTGVSVRVYDGAGLGPQFDVVSPWPATLRDRVYTGATGPIVQPFGADGLVIAFAGCAATALANDCRSTAIMARVDMFTSNSLDSGATWTPPLRLFSANDPTTQINEAPGLAVVGSNRRFVLWNSRDPGFVNYRLLVRVGSGTV